MTGEPGRQLRAGEVESLLTELRTRLDRRGVAASVYIFGGAAVILRHHSRTATDDIDAAFNHRDEVLAVVRELAAEHNLPANWLNDAGRKYLPVSADDKAEPTRFAPGWTVASDEHLLAQKLYAGRLKDHADIVTLIRSLNIRDADEFMTTMRSMYGDDVIPALDYDDTKLFLHEMIQRSRRTKP